MMPGVQRAEHGEQDRRAGPESSTGEQLVAVRAPGPGETVLVRSRAHGSGTMPSAISMQSAVRQGLDPQGTAILNTVNNIATSMDPSRLSRRIRRLPLPRVDRSMASRTRYRVTCYRALSPNRSSRNANSRPSSHLALLRFSIFLRILAPVRVLLRIFIVPRKNRCNHHPKVLPIRGCWPL